MQEEPPPVANNTEQPELPHTALYVSRGRRLALLPWAVVVILWASWLAAQGLVILDGLLGTGLLPELHPDLALLITLAVMGLLFAISASSALLSLGLRRWLPALPGRWVEVYSDQTWALDGIRSPIPGGDVRVELSPLGHWIYVGAQPLVYGPSEAEATVFGHTLAQALGVSCSVVGAHTPQDLHGTLDLQQDDDGVTMTLTRRGGGPWLAMVAPVPAWFILLVNLRPAMILWLSGAWALLALGALFVARRQQSWATLRLTPREVEIHSQQRPEPTRHVRFTTDEIRRVALAQDEQGRTLLWLATEYGERHVAIPGKRKHLEDLALWLTRARNRAVGRSLNGVDLPLDGSTSSTASADPDATAAATGVAPAGPDTTSVVTEVDSATTAATEVDSPTSAVTEVDSATTAVTEVDSPTSAVTEVASRPSAPAPEPEA